MLLPPVSRPICLGVKPAHEAHDQIFVTLRQLRFVYVGSPLWWEEGCVVYNYSWASPAQSFSGPSPAVLMAIFHCLRFETPPIWRTSSQYLYPPGTGWLSYSLRHWISSSSPPTTRRAAVMFQPTSTKVVFLRVYPVRVLSKESLWVCLCIPR
jgi:hypothetical protein